MTDREWLRNLATARYQEGRLVAQDEDAARHLETQRAFSQLHEMHRLAAEAAEVFNEYTAPSKRLRVFPLGSDELGQGATGFVLMLGKTQLKLERAGACLEAVLTTSSQFQTRSRTIHRYEPRSDNLGLVLWSADNRLLLNEELIIKQLFEDLARAAHELR